MSKAMRFGLAGLVAASLLGAVAASTPAMASTNRGGGIQASGNCSMNSTWVLKAKADNGRIETEFEVDSNVVGQTWKVVEKDNGILFFRGKKVTKAPSGSFLVRKLIDDQAGTDNITAKAKNPATDEVCKGSVSL